jgi:hypothetical protein
VFLINTSVSPLKAGSAIEAKNKLDSREEHFRGADYVIPKDNSACDIVVQYLELEAEYTDFCNSRP